MRHTKRRYGFVLAGLVLVLGSLAGLLSISGLGPVMAGWRRGHEAFPVVKVRRADIQMTLTAGGTVDSANRTLIECELEAITFSSNGGGSFSARGASRILTLIPEGTSVVEGDLLCELDASEYVELVRQQQLKVEEARADHRGAELRLQTALSSLQEFREGLRGQSEQGLQSNVTLAESNLQSARERLAFSEKLFQYGYVASSKLTTDRLTVLRAEEALRQSRVAVDKFERYEVPMQDLSLQAAVDTARADLSYQTLRLGRHLDRLKVYQRQVELCTIRAPHDGFVIYANEDDDDTKIQLGSTVRTKQDLFYLPDLGHMRVHALIHESQVETVEVGMTAQVRVDALSHELVPGKVVGIDQMPYRNRDWRASPDVKYFIVKIELAEVPRGLKPGMTAGIEIQAGERHDALVLPVEAIGHVDGHEFVFVSGPDGIERRAISTKPATVDLVCVDNGLNEGDEVVLEPERHADALPGPDETTAPVAH